MTQNTVNSASSVLQVASASIATVVDCTTVTPLDDTIPQKGEGDEVLTLAFTPIYDSSILEIAFTSMVSTDGTSLSIVTALFQDSDDDALAASYILAETSGISAEGSLVHYMTSGTTSSTTFKIRIGPDASHVYVNGDISGTQFFNGVANTFLTITEYLA